MIRHQVYFDRLGSMKEGSAAWRSVFAGLSVLRLIDSYVDTGSTAAPPNWAQLHSVRAAVDDVSAGDPVRGVLTHVVEELTTRARVDETVCAGLMAYGRALDYEASWALAADVFGTVARITKPERNPRLAVEANIAAGGSARRNGDWETSARAYSQAAYVADTMGDRAGVLKVQVGIANTYLAKGNLPHAQAILDDVIIQSRDQNMTDIQGFALHSRASLAQRRGEKAEAVKLAHAALELTTEAAARDAVLEDIAAAFSELGMRDSARDTHLVIAATSQSRWLRWQATINLMELASQDHSDEAFDSYAAELRKAALGPWLHAHFLLMLGEGLERLGRYEAAQQALSEAVDFASTNEIHAVTFKAEEAQASLRARKPRQTTAPVFAQVPGEVLAAAQAISELRKTSLTPV